MMNFAVYRGAHGEVQEPQREAEGLYYDIICYNII